jgi:hypothetical protein
MDKLTADYRAKGYRPRLDGALFMATNVLSMRHCDACHKTEMSLIGFEHNYPEDPDIWVCADCAIEITPGTVEIRLEA